MTYLHEDYDVPDGFSSESQRYEASFAQAAWSNPDPALCGCNGGGWMLSQLDQWHRCPYHGAGLPHPDDNDDLDETLDAIEAAPVALLPLPPFDADELPF